MNNNLKPIFLGSLGIVGGFVFNDYHEKAMNKEMSRNNDIMRFKRDAHMASLQHEHDKQILKLQNDIKQLQCRQKKDLICL